MPPRPRRIPLARRVAAGSALGAFVAATVVGLATVELGLGKSPGAVRGELGLLAIVAGAATVVAVGLATHVIVERLLGRDLRDLTQRLRAAASGRWLARWPVAARQAPPAQSASST